jgi:nickel-dependent lactate racemase
MKVDFAYGEDHISVLLPPDLTVDFFIPREITGYEDLGLALENALAQPIESAPLAELVEREAGTDHNVLLVVSDLTRSGGTKEVLPLLTGYLESRGIARSRLRILVARGTHRKLTKDEKRYFKQDKMQGIQVEEHDCDETSSMSALVLTQRGTPVRVNRLLRDAGLVILVSPVSFHYFAGFGGGRKLVLPGSSDRTAILANHRLSLVDSKPVRMHPRCLPGNLEENPVSEDMGEALAALKNVYGVNFFGDKLGRTVYINSGDPVLSHEEACEVYTGVFRLPVEQPYDVAIVSCGGYPYDINLLQAHKAIKHGAAAVNPGGTILFFAQCREGVGSESFSKALAAPGDRFFENAWEQYDLNNQTGISFKGLAGRYNIEMITDLPDDKIEHAGVKKCLNTEAVLAAALERHGTNRIAVIPYGSQTLPYVRRSIKQ